MKKRHVFNCFDFWVRPFLVTENQRARKVQAAECLGRYRGLTRKRVAFEDTPQLCRFSCSNMHFKKASSQPWPSHCLNRLRGVHNQHRDRIICAGMRGRVRCSSVG